jgi:hypothetical protein
MTNVFTADEVVNLAKHPCHPFTAAKRGMIGHNGAPSLECEEILS